MKLAGQFLLLAFFVFSIFLGDYADWITKAKGVEKAVDLDQLTIVYADDSYGS